MNENLDKTAVVFVDLINTFDFPGSERLLENTKEILPNIIKLKQFAKNNHLPVIYVNDHYGLWQADFNKILEYCTNENSKEVIAQIEPTSDDYFLIKPQHSAFFQTPLQSLLKELDKDHLILAGVAGDICILFTAKDAYMHQMNLTIPSNCMASEEKENNDYALYLMQSVMKANINAFD